MHLPQPSIPAWKLVMPDSTEGMETQPTAMPALPAADTMCTPATTGTTAPPRFLQQPATPSTSQAPPVPPGTVLDQDMGLQAQIANRSMTYLAQSLAMSSAGGNPDEGAFSGIIDVRRVPTSVLRC